MGYLDALGYVAITALTLSFAAVLAIGVAVTGRVAFDWWRKR